MRDARATSELACRLHDALKAQGSPYFGGSRGSIAMPPHDLPLPDIVLTSEPNGDGFIPVSSVPLVIEVAETALDFFMDTKARPYARHGVPEYRVADLNGGTVHQMWSPATGAYAERRMLAPGARITAAAARRHTCRVLPAPSGACGRHPCRGSAQQRFKLLGGGGFRAVRRAGHPARVGDIAVMRNDASLRLRCVLQRANTGARRSGF